ncbi:MAG: prolyl oligopeptidase family serine peptidase [Tannerella sp.]|jgi:dipeptidyl aminopeptidase/acylaminoacyl peptidase|nr:prolyl oligopeptidase family serine peptidase [Tannerella sp.]
MNRKKIAVISALALLPMCVIAQKKPLDHNVYDAWESVTDMRISPDGQYAAHLVSPQEGDSLLEVTHLRTLATVRVERGCKPQFSADSRILVFQIKPSQAEKKQAQKDKKKADEMPKDSLGYITLPALEVHKSGVSGGYRMPEKAAVYFAYTAPMPQDTSSAAPKDERNDYLIVHHLAGHTHDTLAYVAQYAVPKNGKYLAYVTKPSAADSVALPGVYLYDPATRRSTLLHEGKGEYKAPVFDEEAAQLAFCATSDTTKNEYKAFDLYYTATRPVALQRLAADTLSPQMPEQWGVNPHHAPWFSHNGARLYFSIYPFLPPKDTTVSESEKVLLDIWHYNDDYLPTVQLKQLNNELKRPYLCVFHLDRPGAFVRLGSPEMADIATADRGNGDYALGFDTRDYRIESQWTGTTRNDVYLLHLPTGEKTVFAKAMDGRPGFSTTGQYLLWFDKADAQWYLYTLATGQTRCLTQGLGVEFQDARRELPDRPGSFGAMGWSRDDRYVYIYDMYDIWQFDPSGQIAPQRITKGYGRENGITFRNIRLSDEYEYVDDKEPFLFSAFDNRTKEGGFFTLSPRKGLKRQIQGKYTFSTPVKAKNADVFIYTKSNFRTPPDLWKTADLWKQETQISHINPQMKEYLWGTPEPVYWTSKDGYELEGILYKPEDFDPEKKYPLLIYFYEKHADELYRYFAPLPSRSIINIPFFCSRGYLVFTPNIHYVDGHPGRSACNSIIAGAEMLCQYPWVDKEHIGIQGQSWGGYQVAYLITQTHMFAAAGAGAPVVNMTSAYGGIRWSTGLNRQMQYERQQSRIGKTLWEGFDLYVENSPLFFADKVETPLLMTHNDNDGAVPWYQGIEYFTALRRLGKTVWMLQYNGEEHNLTQRRNMRDLSIRLQQFFDHYLLGAPMPVWMKDGVPATQKGRTYGLELTTE